MMALHVHLVLRRLRALGMGRSDIGQDLFDMFFGYGPGHARGRGRRYGRRQKGAENG